MTDLSLEAQAVLNAYEEASDGEYVEGVWVVNERSMLAAAVVALADQVVPDEPDYMRAAVPDTSWWDKHDLIRSEILAIAAKLDPKSPTP